MDKRLLLGITAVAFSFAAGFALGHHYRPAEPRTYTFIEQQLYVGGAVTTPPPGTQAVLNLCEWDDPYRVDVYEHEPIPDSDEAPSIAWLDRMVNFIHNERLAGRTVFVHCHAGISRSGLVIVAYEMAEDHMTRDEALAAVRGKRPEVEPNPAFMQLLADFEHYLQHHPVQLAMAPNL